jgi:hypothetical protein
LHGLSFIRGFCLRPGWPRLVCQMASVLFVSAERQLGIFSGTVGLPSVVGVGLRIITWSFFRAGFTGGQCCLVMAELLLYCFYGLWHCLRIVVLFVLWKLWCKLVFDHEPSSLSAFSSVWKDEVVINCWQKEFC